MKSSVIIVMLFLGVCLSACGGVMPNNGDRYVGHWVADTVVQGYNKHSDIYIEKDKNDFLVREVSSIGSINRENIKTKAVLSDGALKFTIAGLTDTISYEAKEDKILWMGVSYRRN